MPANQAARKRGKKTSGKLRIGDDWNAINIIALSQQLSLYTEENLR